MSLDSKLIVRGVAVCAVLVGCTGRELPRAVPGSTAPVVESRFGGTGLGDILMREVGTDGPVAVFAGEGGLIAVSADGKRSRVIYDSSALWAKVDARARVIWFGTTAQPRDVMLVDLMQPPTSVVRVATGIPEDANFDIAYENSDGNCVERLTTHTAVYNPTVSLVLGGPSPRFTYSGGVIVEIDEDAERIIRAGLSLTADGKAFLRVLADRRDGGMPAVLPVPESNLPRVTTVPTSNCQDEEMCGVSAPVPGTSTWLVIVNQSCGDGCYTVKQLYDPKARVFADLASPTTKSPTPLTNVASLDELWISADGIHVISDGSIYRFDSGLVRAGLGMAAGWLGGQWLIY